MLLRAARPMLHTMACGLQKGDAWTWPRVPIDHVIIWSSILDTRATRRGRLLAVCPGSSSALANRDVLAEQLRGQTVDDRPDLVARIFKTKLDQIMQYLTKRHKIGQVQDSPSLQAPSHLRSASRAALISVGVAEAGRRSRDRVPEARPAARAHNEPTGCTGCLAVCCSAPSSSDEL